MRKGGSLQKERPLFFLNRRWGGLTPKTLLSRAYVTTYMPLKETPIYLFIASQQQK